MGRRTDLLDLILGHVSDGRVDRLVDVVWVRVRAGDEDGTVGEEGRGRVVESVDGRDSRFGPLGARGGLRIKVPGLMEGLVGVRSTDGPSLVSVAGGTEVSAVTHPESSIGHLRKQGREEK
jgi:hypothetical protein